MLPQLNRRGPTAALRTVIVVISTGGVRGCFPWIPAPLEESGKVLFGWRDFHELCQRIVISNHTYAGIRMQMATLSEDDTLARMRSESADPYRLRRLSADQHVVQIKEGLILDVGSNMGEFAVAAAMLAPTLQVIAVEPTPVAYWLLRLNLHMNLRDRHPIEGDMTIETMLNARAVARRNQPANSVLAFNAAVGDGSVKSTTVMYNTRFTQNAVTGVRASKSGGWDSREVDVINLKDLIHGRRVAYLKIDCEGCEFQAIPAISKMFADRHRIALFGGEMHLNTLAPSYEGAAVRPSLGQAWETSQLLSKRGCASESSGNKWTWETVVC